MNKLAIMANEAMMMMRDDIFFMAKVNVKSGILYADKRSSKIRRL
jgi:hypothetical protein